MKFQFSLSLLSTLLLPTVVVQADHADDADDLKWSVLKATLPKALSDHTATLSVPNRKVYIAGGCDDPNGNSYAVYDGQGGFYCNSISDEFYAFDLDTETFETLPTMLRPRYRHASVIVGSQLWVVGGRSLDNDTLLDAVDVFDMDSGIWTSHVLPEEYRVSDHAGFGKEDPNYVYIAGGYDQNYAALDKVYRIDTVASSTTSSLGLSITPMASMNVGRGDITGVTAEDGIRAYLGGGFTDQNGFCAPIESVEQYDFVTDTWTMIDPLLNARGEIIFLELDDQLYSLGGERQIENICNVTNTTDPGEHTVGMSVVELWQEGEDWLEISNFPNHKFRFAAIGWTETDTVYAFGGQQEYNLACECFQTSNEISILTSEHSHDDGTKHSHSGDVTAGHTHTSASAIVTTTMTVLSLMGTLTMFF